jgi:hypothetical protein
MKTVGRKVAISSKTRATSIYSWLKYIFKLTIV